MAYDQRDYTEEIILAASLVFCVLMTALKFALESHLARSESYYEKELNLSL